MFAACRWLNEPADWRLGPDGLSVTTDGQTDFWRQTHYGFVRDSGHFFGRPVEAPFVATLRVRARYQALYDQAGIMVRVDESHWIKAGIELVDGAATLGSVLTAGRSDWATGPFAGDPADLWLRVEVGAGVLQLHASPDGQRWQLARMCPFPEAARYEVGPMCCTPERAGLEVTFSDFSIDRPTSP